MAPHTSQPPAEKTHGTSSPMSLMLDLSLFFYHASPPVPMSLRHCAPAILAEYVTPALLRAGSRPECGALAIVDPASHPQCAFCRTAEPCAHRYQGLASTSFCCSAPGCKFSSSFCCTGARSSHSKTSGVDYRIRARPCSLGPTRVGRCNQTTHPLCCGISPCKA